MDDTKITKWYVIAGDSEKKWYFIVGDTEIDIWYVIMDDTEKNLKCCFIVNDTVTH